MARDQKIYHFSATGRNASDDRRYRESRQNYIYGSAVPKQDIRRQLETEPRRQLSNEARKNRDKAHHMNLGYVVFLVAALCCAGIVLINYIQLQSDITNLAEAVAGKERQLNNLIIDNDETLNRINASIDMEEVKRIAIGELGTVYAGEGQIETYTAEDYDYLRRVSKN